MSKDIHIGIFGRRNQGKSSLINLLTGQETAIVSPRPGTTTDPVKKSCEIFGLGKCVLVDTAGYDDDGTLGRQRVEKTRDTVERVDVGILLISADTLASEDKAFADRLQREKIPFLMLHNKADRQPLSETLRAEVEARYPQSAVLDFSVKAALEEVLSTEKTLSSSEPSSGGNAPESASLKRLTVCLQQLLERHGTLGETGFGTSVLEGIVRAGDPVLLVCPVDGEAPKDRLILPQVMMSRQCLDLHALPILCQTEELPSAWEMLDPKPALVITDSQVFGQVAARLPEECPLTSFSICLARQKGNFELYRQGTEKLAELEDGQEILILESCTHQVNCQDIGRVKLPAAVRKATGKELKFRFVSGLDPLPEDLSAFALAIQCGGCMVTARQLAARIGRLQEAGIPVSNYGMALAWAGGIFERATKVFPA